MTLEIMGISIYIIIFIATRNYRKESLSELRSKMEVLSILYPMALWIADILNKFWKEAAKRQLKIIKTLFPRSNAEQMLIRHCCRKYSCVLLIIIIGLFLPLLIRPSAENIILNDENVKLERPKPGEGEEQIKLIYQTKDGRNNEIFFQIQEREVLGKEKEEMFESAIEYLERVVLNQNISYDFVSGDLFFPLKIPNSSVKVEWRTENSAILGWDGKIYNESLLKSETICATAILTYLEEAVEYKKSFVVLPKQFSAEEYLKRQIRQKIIINDNNSVQEKFLTLPSEIDGQELKWKPPKQQNGLQYILVSCLAAFLSGFAVDGGLTKREKYRKEQLLEGYPNIINKFILFLEAGLTVKGAWTRIVTEYLQSKKSHYAYEEILTSYYEMETGRSESAVYEEFGKRCALLPYLRFSTLVVQNLKMGNKGLIPLLHIEAAEAFEERKQYAKRKGEEASTKLLIPMMGMLLIVIVVLIVPAFFSFRI